MWNTSHPIILWLQMDPRGVVYGHNVVNMTLPISSHGGATVNHNAVFCIFELNHKMHLYLHSEALNIPQKLYK